MNKDIKKFLVKVVCKKCNSENCGLDGYGNDFDSGIYILCEDCGNYEEVSNYGNTTDM
jgi:ribosomal protein S27E